MYLVSDNRKELHADRLRAHQVSVVFVLSDCSTRNLYESVLVHFC